jgi:hypothetical protein
MEGDGRIERSFIAYSAAMADPAWALRRGNIVPGSTWRAAALQGRELGRNRSEDKMSRDWDESGAPLINVIRTLPQTLI